MFGREIDSELDGLERTPGRIRRWRHGTVLALQIDASPAIESPVALVFLLSFLQDVLY